MIDEIVNVKKNLGHFKIGERDDFLDEDEEGIYWSASGCCDHLGDDKEEGRGTEAFVRSVASIRDGGNEI